MARKKQRAMNVEKFKTFRGDLVKNNTRHPPQKEWVCRRPVCAHLVAACHKDEATSSFRWLVAFPLLYYMQNHSHVLTEKLEKFCLRHTLAPIFADVVIADLEHQNVNALDCVSKLLHTAALSQRCHAKTH